MTESRPYSRIPRSDRFLESFIDRQIDHYLSELREKTRRIKENFQRAEEARKTVYRESVSSTALVGGQKQWGEALDAVADATGDLRRMLIYVFTGLEDKDDFEPRLERSHDEDSTYEKAMLFLEGEIQKAEVGIDEYLFTPTNKVHLDDLQAGNMLITLHHVEAMAKALKDQRIGE